MTTRYFKRNAGEICTMSSGNRSKEQPGTPGYPYDWVEIEKDEFVRLRRAIQRGPVVQRVIKSAIVQRKRSKNT